MVRAFILAGCVCIASGNVFGESGEAINRAVNDSTQAPSWHETPVRVRVFAGGVSLLGKPIPLVNVNWRLSPPSPASLGRVWSGGLAAEYGLTYFFPYARIGPEVRYRQSSVAAGVGMFVIALPGSGFSLYGAVPPLSFTAGTTFPMNSSFSFEAEAGVHIFPGVRALMPYVQLGISY